MRQSLDLPRIEAWAEDGCWCDCWCDCWCEVQFGWPAGLVLKPRTEELLYFLLWSADQLMRPTFRNLEGSFESWAYRNGLLRRLAALEKERLVERPAAADQRICRLTAEGRLHALGGRDPAVQWSRRWDGHWRLMLFDVPLGQGALRSRLRRYLHARNFGYLQNSVWITPDPMETELASLRGSRINVEALLLLEAKPCAGESDAEIVAGAWDFERINRGYRHHLKVLSGKPAGRVEGAKGAQELRRWAAAERAAWLAAVRIDPLLPERLLPKGYLGRSAWQKRVEVLGRAGRDMRGFTAGLARRNR